MERATLPVEVTGPPERTYEQRIAALRQADTVRIHRARLKPKLRSGELELADLFEDPLCATMRVYDALVHVPKIGRVKANAILTRTRISPSKSIGGLTPRQRRELVGALP